MESLRQLEGKYAILEKLHEGGMGSIYLVRHRLLNQHRVVKTMQRQLAAEEEFRNRFLQEAQLAASLTHPNIAQIHDFTVDESGVGFIVMEYIDGVSLKEILVASGAPRLEPTLEIAKQTLRALSFLHRQGYVHRDISPDNIMLSEDVDGRPQVKLIDLGIAKKLGGAYGLTTAGNFLGKLRYSCPENFDKEGVIGADERSDVYSFGLVLYELLTGQPAVVGDDLPSLYVGHVNRPPQDFVTTDPEGKVPNELRQMVLRALDKDPAMRFANADTFGDALSQVQAAYPIAPDFNVATLLGPARANRRRRLEKMVGEMTQVQLDQHFGLGTVQVPQPRQPEEVGGHPEAPPSAWPQAPSAAPPPAPYAPRPQAPHMPPPQAVSAQGEWGAQPSPGASLDGTTHVTSFDHLNTLETEGTQRISSLEASHPGATHLKAPEAFPEPSAASNETPVIRQSPASGHLPGATRRLDHHSVEEVRRAAQEEPRPVSSWPEPIQRTTTPSTVTSLTATAPEGAASSFEEPSSPPRSDRAPHDSPVPSSAAGDRALHATLPQVAFPEDASSGLGNGVVEPEVAPPSLALPEVHSVPLDEELINEPSAASSPHSRGDEVHVPDTPALIPNPESAPSFSTRSQQGPVTVDDRLPSGSVSPDHGSAAGPQGRTDVAEGRSLRDASESPARAQQSRTPSRSSDRRGTPWLPIAGGLAGAAILVLVLWGAFRFIKGTAYQPPEPSLSQAAAAPAVTDEVRRQEPEEPEPPVDAQKTESSSAVQTVTKPVDSLSEPETSKASDNREPAVDLEDLGFRLLKSLRSGPIHELKAVTLELRHLSQENPEAFGALDGAVRTAFERADGIIEMQEELRQAKSQGDHITVIRLAQELTKSYPHYVEFAQNHREKAAAAVEERALDLERRGDVEGALSELRSLDAVWPERDGLAAKMAELESS